METPLKFSSFYPACKGGFRDLTERLVHNVISYSFVGWAVIFSSLVKLFIVGERFAQWSS